MAETLQAVCWSLERKCIFRSGENWFLPTHTHMQLTDLRTVAEAQADNRIFDGVCVIGFTENAVTFDESMFKLNESGEPNWDTSRLVPTIGFRVHDRLGRFGGISNAIDVCGQCEANAEGELKASVAGCFGYLNIGPDFPELDKQLWKVIKKKGLEKQLRLAFQVTKPLWYGFWIDSPLKRPQAELLHVLLSAVCEPDGRNSESVKHFLNALRAAIDWELPVHVNLAP